MILYISQAACWLWSHTIHFPTTQGIMMRTGSIACLCLFLGMFFLLPATTIGQTDPLVEEMVAAVSQTRLVDSMQALQDFGTRYTYTQGNTDAGDWLFAYFASLGLEVERHEFSYSGQTEENIIARLPGTTLPDEVIIISGHFDSTSQQPSTLAPGADDNASAIASVLESALIYKDYEFERTIEFVCFNAEEQGRRGSTALSAEYQSAGTDLIAVVNTDMIGYWPTGWQRDLDVAYEPVSLWLADHVISASDRYVGIPIARHLSGSCRDDHYSFTSRGFAGVTNMDCWDAHNGGIGGESTPHYHRTTDTIATLNLPCMTQCVQVNVAAAAELAGPVAAAGLGNVQAVVPDATAWLVGNSPNPFSRSTAIEFVAQSPAPARVSLRVFDPQGRLVRRITDQVFEPGAQAVSWDGRDEFGRPVSSGVYFYRLESGSVTEIRKLALTR